MLLLMEPMSKSNGTVVKVVVDPVTVVYVVKVTVVVVVAGHGARTQGKTTLAPQLPFLSNRLAHILVASVGERYRWKSSEWW